MSRGVQDESLLEEHLEQCNMTKKSSKMNCKVWMKS